MINSVPKLQLCLNLASSLAESEVCLGHIVQQEHQVGRLGLSGAKVKPGQH